MKALIIGAGGFVGGYLIRELSSAGWDVHASCLPTETIRENCTVHHLDIMEKDSITALLNNVMPDIITLRHRVQYRYHGKNPSLPQK